MLVIPVYDLALLPGASLYLKKEYYEELAGKQAEQGAIFLDTTRIFSTSLPASCAQALFF